MVKFIPAMPGPLAIIATILIGSALMRLPLLATEALALDDGSKSAVASTPALGDTGQLDKLLATLKERESILQEREAGLDARELELQSLEGRVAEKVAELRDAEASLRDVLAIADSAAEDDVARLTAVYENMKPKDAADVFDKMEPSFAAGFLSRMRADAAAAIMAALPPETAYAISVELAGRHVEAVSR